MPMRRSLHVVCGAAMGLSFVLLNAATFLLYFCTGSKGAEPYYSLRNRAVNVLSCIGSEMPNALVDLDGTLADQQMS
jgi:hypothetical protein